MLHMTLEVQNAHKMALSIGSNFGTCGMLVRWKQIWKQILEAAYYSMCRKAVAIDQGHQVVLLCTRELPVQS